MGWSAVSPSLRPIPNETRLTISFMTWGTSTSSARRSVSVPRTPHPRSYPAPETDRCSGYAITPPIGWLYPTWPSASSAARTASPASAHRASCSTARGSTSPRISSGVLGIDRHVLVTEVGEEHLGLVAVAGQTDDVLDLVAGDRRGERLDVEGQRGAGRADLHALDGDVQRQRRRVDERAADGLGDAPPVGVAAVQRRLDQRRICDRARRVLDAGRVASAHDDAPDAP